SGDHPSSADDLRSGRPPSPAPSLFETHGRRTTYDLDRPAVGGVAGSTRYVENVAAAIALAAVSPKAANRVYNVAESPAYSELDWAAKIAAAAGWSGRILVLPSDRMPAHLFQPGNPEQHREADSTRIRTELHYHEPVALDEALPRTIDWERANPPG